MKILLLEDERMLRESLREYLETLGHEVKECEGGEKALALGLSQPFDLFLFDVSTPQKSGFEVAKELSLRRILTPLIFMTARVEIEDISKGFELGCIDYIKKPFHLKELALRLQNLPQKTSTPRLIALGGHYAFDLATATLYEGEHPKNLTPRQREILKLLCENQGKVVDFDLFRERIYTEGFVDNATIRAEVSRLKKLFDEEFIQNIRALGYSIA